MIAARLPDWRPRLVAYLEEVRHRPFAYGSHDCALFVAGAVESMTGFDASAGFRGRYDDLKAGLKLVAGEDHVQLVRRLFEEVAPAFAQVGDIAVIGEIGIPALGIFEGEMILVLRDEGLGRMPRAAATLAFRVP